MATGGGGYAIVEVVPRAWTHLLAIVSGAAARPRHGDAAESWREHVRRRARPDAAARGSPTAGPPAYRDWREGYDPETWLDRAIHATRTAVFPLHGLDPLP